jgi:hypothetical protein
MTNAELILRFFASLWWLWAIIIGLMLWEYKREGGTPWKEENAPNAD